MIATVDIVAAPEFGEVLVLAPLRNFLVIEELLEALGVVVFVRGI